MQTERVFEDLDSTERAILLDDLDVKDIKLRVEEESKHNVSQVQFEPITFVTPVKENKDSSKQKLESSPDS